MLTLWPGDADTEGGWVRTAWAQDPGRGETEMVTRGSRHKSREPCESSQGLPLSPHPVTCAESDQAEEQRAPGRGGHGQGVLPSVAPQLSRASPARSFPSSCSERGRGLACSNPPPPPPAL